MQVERWPIVGRSQLVRAFRPGESRKEAPFRTLRAHGWATAGVGVVTRDERSASGRLTIFSVLNVDAARLAREGEHRGAAQLAGAAARVESSKGFLELKQLLSGHPLEEVSAVLEGGAPEDQWPDLHELLRQIARETKATRTRISPRVKLSGVVTGRVSEAQGGFVVLTAEGGARTAVPRWLAQSAHRANVGDLLALVTEKLDDQQMVVNALPGIETSRASPKFSPFGRRAKVHALTAADAKKLAGSPAPLHILVPVSIGA